MCFTATWVHSFLWQAGTYRAPPVLAGAKPYGAAPIHEQNMTPGLDSTISTQNTIKSYSKQQQTQILIFKLFLSITFSMARVHGNHSWQIAIFVENFRESVTWTVLRLVKWIVPTQLIIKQRLLENIFFCALFRIELRIFYIFTKCNLNVNKQQNSNLNVKNYN